MGFGIRSKCRRLRSKREAAAMGRPVGGLPAFDADRLADPNDEHTQCKAG